MFEQYGNIGKVYQNYPIGLYVIQEGKWMNEWLGIKNIFYLT